MENNFADRRRELTLQVGSGKGLMAIATGDTIVAISSGQGRSGIGVVRLSGSDCSDICFDVTGVRPKHKQVFFAHFKNQEGIPIDSGIVLFFEGPHSFTGEDVLELQAHGNPIILRELISISVQSGARQARPGEFTERAFRNGKLSLDRAEAVADLIASQTRRATISAARTLTGVFSTKANEILNSIRQSLYQIEATIDFQEEVDSNKIRNILKVAASQQIGVLSKLISKTEIGIRLKEGFYIVILGAPNVGKSTLLNQLANSDMAIVSDIPGTTRDPVKIAIDIDGIPAHIVDTAGIHDTLDELEATGIERTKLEAEKADIILYLSEEDFICVDGLEASVRQLSPNIKGDIIFVRNKVVLVDKDVGIVTLDNKKVVNISARKGLGIDLLFSTISDSLMPSEGHEDEFVARERHLNALRKTSDILTAIDFNIFENSPELVAEEYRQACRELEVLAGKYTTEDMLGDIFSRFCIGK